MLFYPKSAVAPSPLSKKNYVKITLWNCDVVPYGDGQKSCTFSLAPTLPRGAGVGPILEPVHFSTAWFLPKRFLIRFRSKPLKISLWKKNQAVRGLHFTKLTSSKIGPPLVSPRGPWKKNSRKNMQDFARHCKVYTLYPCTIRPIFYRPGR